jgi:hypothetical protein
MKPADFTRLARLLHRLQVLEPAPPPRSAQPDREGFAQAVVLRADPAARDEYRRGCRVVAAARMVC